MMNFRGGYPALNWLVKKAPNAAFAIFQHMNDSTSYIMDEGQPDTHLNLREASSDDAESFEIFTDDADEVPEISEAPITSATLSNGAGGPDEVNPEMLHEIQPSINAIFADLSRVRFTLRIDGTMHRVDGLGQLPVFRGTRAQLAGMEFDCAVNAPVTQVGGTMLFFTDQDGRKKQPSYTAKKPRGGKRPIRTADCAAAYLALCGAVPIPLNAVSLLRPLSGEPALMPMFLPLPQKPSSELNKSGRFGVIEGRLLLQSLGVDGAVSFAELPFTATKCPPAIARNARFIGGITALKETRSTPAINEKFEKEQPDISVISRIALEEVHARGTLTDIGIRLGYKKGYADRAGGKAITAAGYELIAANENKIQKLAA